jgi:hypothetical protein
VARALVRAASRLFSTLAFEFFQARRPSVDDHWFAIAYWRNKKPNHSSREIGSFAEVANGVIDG